MRNLFLLSALASAALLSSTAAASQTAPAPAQTEENQTAPAPKPVKVKKICRPEENSYSRLPKTICKTQAEWNATPRQDIDKIKRN